MAFFYEQRSMVRNDFNDVHTTLVMKAIQHSMFKISNFDLNGENSLDVCV